MHGGGVADVLGVCLADICLAHEVDEHLCSFLMLTGSRNGHAVHRQHAALLREHPCKVGVVIDHGDGIAGVVHADGCLAADHLIEDLVHDVCLHQRLLRLEFLHHLVHFFGRLRVDVVAALKRSYGVGIAAVVEHQDIACVLLVPQISPAGGCFVHHGGIINDAGGTEHVGHSVGILRIVIRIHIFLIDLFEVRDIVVVQRLEHPLGDHFRHHVIRRNDHIVVGCTGLELGVHGFVGVKGSIVHLDAGELLKRRHHIHAVVRTVGDILAPVVNVDGDILALEAGPIVIIRYRDVLRDFDGAGSKGGQCTADHHCQRQQQNSKTFHHTPSPLSAF